MSSIGQRIYVVTGANKGIGLATVKALCQKVDSDGVVYLTARDVGRGTAAVQQLTKDGLQPKFHQLDAADSSSIETFAEHLKKEHGGLDVLVNNGAIAYKKAATESFAVQAKETIRINYFGLQKVCHILFPLIRPNGRVVNVSSCVGHLSKVPGEELKAKLASQDLTESVLDNMMTSFVEAAQTGAHVDAGWQNSAYSVSKIGVSALTRIQQREAKDNILINHCHPGYVDTDMTSHAGPLTPEQGAVASTFLALIPPEATEPRGQYIWHDKQVVDWVNGPIPAPGY